MSSAGRALLSTPMSRNTWTPTSAAAARAWAPTANEPLTHAAAPSASVSVQLTANETNTLRRVVPASVVSFVAITFPVESREREGHLFTRPRHGFRLLLVVRLPSLVAIATHCRWTTHELTEILDIGRLGAVEHYDSAPPLGSERAVTGGIQQRAPAAGVQAHEGCRHDTPAALLPGDRVPGRRVEQDEDRLAAADACAGRDQPSQPAVSAAGLDDYVRVPCDRHDDR